MTCFALGLWGLGSAAFCQQEDDEDTILHLPPPETLLEEIRRPEVPASARTSALNFRWALARLEKFEPASGIGYSDVYGNSGGIMEIGYDRFLLQSRFGAVTVGGAGSIFYDRGHDPAARNVTLIAFPISTFVSYRMEIVQRQLLIPFTRVGAGAWIYRQRSNFGPY
jgi:hypothetical protein